MVLNPPFPHRSVPILWKYTTSSFSFWSYSPFFNIAKQPILSQIFSSSFVMIWIHMFRRPTTPIFPRLPLTHWLIMAWPLSEHNANIRSVGHQGHLYSADSIRNPQALQTTQRISGMKDRVPSPCLRPLENKATGPPRRERSFIIPKSTQAKQSGTRVLFFSMTKCHLRKKPKRSSRLNTVLSTRNLTTGHGG